MTLSLQSLLLSVLLLCGAAGVQAGEPSPAPTKVANKTVLLDVKPDPWQVRRKRVIDLVDAIIKSNYKDKAASDEFEKLLTSFDKDFTVITPMEGMDLQRLYYIPSSPPEEMASNLGAIAALATLGWYDALRFADESGRAEIKHNENFFMSAFTAPGSSAKADMVAFLQSKQEEAASAVKFGTDTARRMLPRVHYDVRWPASYGLLRTQCALQGNKNCSRPTPMPQDQWPAAFEEAVAQVTRYYRDNTKR
jgi:hypothetical protein